MRHVRGPATTVEPNFRACCFGVQHGHLPSKGEVGVHQHVHDEIMVPTCTARSWNRRTPQRRLSNGDNGPSPGEGGGEVGSTTELRSIQENEHLELVNIVRARAQPGFWGEGRGVITGVGQIQGLQGMGKFRKQGF